jgi:hypothetical protein
MLAGMGEFWFHGAGKRLDGRPETEAALKQRKLKVYQK